MGELVLDFPSRHHPDCSRSGSQSSVLERDMCVCTCVSCSVSVCVCVGGGGGVGVRCSVISDSLQPHGL